MRIVLLLVVGAIFTDNSWQWTAVRFSPSAGDLKGNFELRQRDLQSIGLAGRGRTERQQRACLIG